MQKSNRYKKLLIIVNILLLISLIGVILSKLKYSTFWLLSAVVIFVSLLLLREVDKTNMDLDKHESKLIKRGYNDSTTLIIVLYMLVYLVIIFIQAFNEKLVNNIYLISGFTLITYLVQLFTYVSIKSAMKDTSKLLDKPIIKK